MILFPLVLLVFSLSSLSTNTQLPPGRLSPGDPSSYSLPEECRVVHSHLSLTVDFEEEVVRGHVTLKTQRIAQTVRSLVLDTKDLKIKSVDDGSNLNKLSYKLPDKIGNFGSKLEINLDDFETLTPVVRIHYETSSNGSALLWLKKHQTADKTYPYFFTQCAPINARSFYPCQDSPSVKSTYSAEIRAPKGLNVLMGANRTGLVEEGNLTVATFQQDLPVPAYLMALAVGRIESRVIGPRSKVWAEPSIVEKAAREFEDTEKMMEIAESICGPYLWGKYDILVLPPSFPFGGMENPTLTYITPTILGGDKSGINVIAHEIAHSWTGNLVTHFNFEHFWIKEAFTVFLERKIMGRIYGEPTRQFLALGGWKNLEDAIQRYGENNPLTKLHLNLTGLDPTDSFSKVPYEKGSTVIWYWNEVVQDSALFEKFIRHFVNKWKFQSITLDDLLATLFDFFEHNGPKEIYEKLLDMNQTAWFEEPGLPPFKPQFDTSLADASAALAARWFDYDRAGNESCPFSKSDLSELGPLQQVEFLAQLLLYPTLKLETIMCMDEAYEFLKNGNYEIRFRWLRVGIKARYKPVIKEAFAFARLQGRIYYNQPLFRDLYGWEEVRDEAIEAYYQIKDTWMFLTSYLVGRELKVIT